MPHLHNLCKENQYEPTEQISHLNPRPHVAVNIYFNLGGRYEEFPIYLFIDAKQILHVIRVSCADDSTISQFCYCS